jgi:hypothetical protein
LLKWDFQAGFLKTRAGQAGSTSQGETGHFMRAAGGDLKCSKIFSETWLGGVDRIHTQT